MYVMAGPPFFLIQRIIEESPRYFELIHPLNTRLKCKNIYLASHIDNHYLSLPYFVLEVGSHGRKIKAGWIESQETKNIVRPTSQPLAASYKS